ncbi:MAG: META domain-containing protein [Dermatophilaceae bacterium]
MGRLALVVAALTLAACGSQAAAPGSSGGGTGSGDNMGGMIPVATLTDITGVYESNADQPRPPKPLVAGTTIRLTILDATIRVDAGCNAMSGSARVEASQLVVGDLAMTEMGCERALMDQDAWLASWLASKPRLDRSGPYLGLVRGDDWLAFTRTKHQILPDETPASPDSAVSSEATSS